MNKIKIVLVEDQRLFRDGMLSLLKDVEDFEMMGVMENGKIFLDKLATYPVKPDIVLLDLNMPEMNGVEVSKVLQRKYPDIKVIILTVYDQERFINKMVEAGASSYLVKNCDLEEVIHSIRTVYKSDFYFNDNVIKAMRNASKSKGNITQNNGNVQIELTDREKLILQLICKELTNSEIAEKLQLSTRTVDGHRNNILAKTGCRNTAGLVLYAVNNGIFESNLF
jgi:DNA-binding NarL/FixJ family response regulator